jgi:hypothetical protein
MREGMAIGHMKLIGNGKHVILRLILRIRLERLNKLIC